MSAGENDAAIQPRIVEWLCDVMPQATALSISGFSRIFGGNARIAWAFDLHWTEAGQRKFLPCIMLSQVAGRHVDSDVTAEYRLLKAITGCGSRAPAALALDAEGRVSGGPAIVLQRLEGEASAVAFLNHANEEEAQQRCRDLAVASAELHRIEVAQVGLFTGIAPREAALDQISHWEQQFLDHRQEPLPVVVHLFSWLKRHCPTPTRLCLVHGDLRPGNFLYRGADVTALLDWEMAHAGDPAEDIAWIYRPLWSPEKFMPIEEFVRVYRERAGFDIGMENLRFYQVFSEMKFAALSLTASHSALSGQSDNLRHLDRAAKVAASLARCFELIDGLYREAVDVSA